MNTHDIINKPYRMQQSECCFFQGVFGILELPKVQQWNFLRGTGGYTVVRWLGGWGSDVLCTCVSQGLVDG